jgi:hypothetical protein
MTLNGGKRGILVNAANTCTAPELATAQFLGQNNRGVLLRPPVRPHCPGKAKHAKGKRGTARGRGR